MAWAELWGLPQSSLLAGPTTVLGCSPLLGRVHPMLPGLSPQHSLGVGRAAGQFVLLAFWPRVLALKSRKVWLESWG